MGSFSTVEMLLVGAVILLVFGGAWLPKLARNLGRTKVEVEKAKSEFEDTKAKLSEAAGPLNDVAQTVKKVDQTLKSPAKAIVKKNL